MNTTNIRIPRPKHTTIQSINKDYNSLYQSYTSYYINNNFTLNGFTLSFEDFSRYTGIPISFINSNLIGNDNTFINLSSNETINRAAGEIFSRSISLSLENISRLARRTQGLLEFENNTYKPFVTNAVTGAVDSMLRATANLASLANQLKAFKTEDLPSDSGHQNHITITEALVLISGQEKAKSQLPVHRDETKSLSAFSESLTDLYLENGLKDLPEVVARPTELDGITKAKLKELEAVDVYKVDKISEKLGLG